MANELIHFTDGQVSTIMNNNTHKRTVSADPNLEVSFELKYINLSKLSSVFPDESKRKTTKPSQIDLNVSISKYGILMPIIVYPNDFNGDDTKGYSVIDGEKRIQAFKATGRQQIFAIVAYNVTPDTAQVMRVLLKQRVHESPLDILDYETNLRNITSDISEHDFETMVNYKYGTLDIVRSLQRRLKLNENSNNGTVHNEEQAIFGKLLLGDILPKDALDEFDKIEKKQEKKKEKTNKETEKLEKENGISDDKDSSDGDENIVGDSHDANGEPTTKDDLFEMGEQNYQQYVGDERRILPASLTKQLYARDDSQCAICGYGGPKNLSVAAMLEKHHIIDVQYGGTDNINNLVLLCPNCHRLVTNYLNGKANEYAPSQDDLKENPQDWGAVVLGNMGRIAKKEALRRIKKVDLDLYNKTLSGKSSVGQSLKKLQLSKIMPKEFNNNSYQTFINALFTLQKQHLGFKIKNSRLLFDYQENGVSEMDDKEITNMLNINGANDHVEGDNNTQELVSPEDKELPTPVNDTKEVIEKKYQSEQEQQDDYSNFIKEDEVKEKADDNDGELNLVDKRTIEEKGPRTEEQIKKSLDASLNTKINYPD